MKNTDEITVAERRAKIILGVWLLLGKKSLEQSFINLEEYLNKYETNS